MKYLLSCFLCILFGFQAWSRNPAEKQARDHAEKTLLAEGYAKSDLAEAVVTAQHTTWHNGLTHVYYQQVYQGLEVIDAVMNTHVDKRGETVGMNNSFHKQLDRKRKAKGRTVAAPMALRLAARQLGIPGTGGIRWIQKPEGVDQACVLRCDNYSLDEIPARLKYVVTDNEELRLVWDLVLRPPSGDHWWNVAVDAMN
ncbi:MAG: hypothetical protein AAF492_23060, partial [Verrucomicrobiota bacterium]